MSRQLAKISPHLVRLGNADNAPSRLICFPEAGGTSRTFQSLAERLGRVADVLGVRLPSRMSRTQEPPEIDLRQVANKVADELLEGRLLDRPYALLGHSMGGIVAYECALRLDLFPPRALAVASTPAPHLMPPTEPVANASDEQLLSHLTASGMDPQLIEHPRLLAPFLPGIRADFAAAEAYRHDPPTQPPLHIPLLAWAGDKDTIVTIDQVSAWEGYAADSFQLTVASGGHNYIETEASLPRMMAEYLQA